ncbi:hypothetical protein ACFUTV_26545 [Streptomyces sp. NPDC057298]|uniref:hypothetical protein n=1 Tax=Streptomyces sp. NPDC057298 TaxID=3346091 RepID=UPI00363D5145
MWRTYRHLYLSALRYDFRCRSIESLLDQVPLSALMEQVLATTSDHLKTLPVLVHGMWLGGLLPGRADALLALVDRLPEGGGDDPLAQFCKASVLRALGQYRQARTAIERPWNSWRRATWPSTPTWCANTP